MLINWVTGCWSEHGRYPTVASAVARASALALVPTVALSHAALPVQHPSTQLCTQFPPTQVVPNSPSVQVAPGAVPAQVVPGGRATNMPLSGACPWPGGRSPAWVEASEEASGAKDRAEEALLLMQIADYEAATARCRWEQLRDTARVAEAVALAEVWKAGVNIACQRCGALGHAHSACPHYPMPRPNAPSCVTITSVPFGPVFVVGVVASWIRLFENFFLCLLYTCCFCEVWLV